MLKSFISLVLLLGVQFAQARSIRTCAPTVQAVPTQIYCTEEVGSSVVYYGIKINTLMSPSTCTGDKNQEIKTATISISKENGELAHIELQDGTFEYNLSNRVSFSTTLINLDLKNCVTPMNGGVSIGN